MDDLYTQRWDQIPDRGRQYITALALLEQGNRAVTTGEVAKALGNPITSWSKEVGRLRDDHGALLAPGRGSVTIAVPGWATWIRNQEHHTPIIDTASQQRIRQLRSVPQPRLAGHTAPPAPVAAPPTLTSETSLEP